MTCKNCTKNSVWEFTNQTKLCKNCFIHYFEKKVFKTIRKFRIIKKDKTIKLKKDNSLNTNVLINILSKKFKVKYSIIPNISSESLSQISEKILKSILKGKFNCKLVKIQNKPLCFLSEKEIKLYSSLSKIKGNPVKSDKSVKELLKNFMNKNQDLEHNILNAFNQLNHLN